MDGVGREGEGGTEAVECMTTDVCVVPVPRCLITDVLTRVVEPRHQQTCVGDIKADEPRRRGGLDGGEGREDAHERLYSNDSTA